MIGHPRQPRMGEAILIGEIDFAEHASQPQVGIFDCGQRIVQPLPDLGGLLAHGIPAMFGRNVEAVLVRVGGFLAVARLGEEPLELLVPHITEPLIEQQAEDVLLVVPGIDSAAKDVRSPPELSFQFLLRQLRQ